MDKSIGRPRVNLAVYFQTEIQKSEVQVRYDKLVVVPSFCYVDDMNFAAGGSELATSLMGKTPRSSSGNCCLFYILLPPIQDITYMCTAHMCSVMLLALPLNGRRNQI